jgi:hypothetical protein
LDLAVSRYDESLARPDGHRRSREGEPIDMQRIVRVSLLGLYALASFGCGTESSNPDAGIDAPVDLAQPGTGGAVGTGGIAGTDGIVDTGIVDTGGIVGTGGTSAAGGSVGMDCPGHVPCDCRASDVDSSPNWCVAGGNCRIDDDCVSGGYCSPSLFGFCMRVDGNGLGSGYFCHTQDDTCTDDADCNGGGYCGYDPSKNLWSCFLCVMPP